MWATSNEVLYASYVNGNLMFYNLMIRCKRAWKNTVQGSWLVTHRFPTLSAAVLTVIAAWLHHDNTPYLHIMCLSKLTNLLLGTSACNYIENCAMPGNQK